MMSRRVKEPSPRVLQAALRKTTERLARELASPSSTAPDWTELEWRTARAVAAIHGVSSLLSSKLVWEGPAGWQQFLRTQRVHTARRAARIQQALRLLDNALKDAGVAAVALKGAALYAMDLYRPGERPMADLDILVLEADLERTTEVLRALRFCESVDCWKHRTFVPQTARPPGRLGEHFKNDIKIELHHRIGERLPLHLVELSDRVFPPHPQPGINPYPSLASLMLHLLLHAAGAMATRTLRLLNVHDLALLSARMGASDWHELIVQGARDRGLWWAFPPLQQVGRYYLTRPGSCPVPDWLLAVAAAGCRRTLRAVSRRQSLSDVSLSQLRIQAFPGIEWAQSWSEMARYVLSRIRPGREMLMLREEVLRTEAWASESPWCELPQYRRMLRWVTSRPPRPATMHAVRAALHP